MLYKEMAKILSYYFFALTLILFIPFFLAFYQQIFIPHEMHPQPYSTLAFFYSIVVCFLVTLFFFLWGNRAEGSLYSREALLVVVFIWAITPLIGALPFYFSKTFDRFSYCYFEATSGFTTTGISIMEPKKYDPVTGEEIRIKRAFCGPLETVYDFYGTITPVRNKAGKIILEGIEAVSPAILFWRSFIQWLGGGGIIILFVALLPILGVGGKILFQTEVTGPFKSPLTPRIKEAALTLWKIYLFLSILQIILLLITNQEMSWFDAITLTFSTVSTGGFTVHSQSIGYYQDFNTEFIVFLFMLVGSINFALYYHAWKVKFYRLFEPELILYLSILFIFSFFVISDIHGYEKISPQGTIEGFFNLAEAIRYGSFQLVSLQSSTGFTTFNYSTWPYLTQGLMLVAMFLGGMSGSTAGGLKIMRHYILFRVTQNKVEGMFRPETIRSFHIGEIEISTSTAIFTLCFFLIVISSSVLATLLYILNGIDPQTALSLAACNINNVGASFIGAGPGLSAAFLPKFSVFLSIILMLLGRLEFYTVLVVLVPAFWKQNK